MPQPFSAKRSRTLPTATSTQDINQTLAVWQNQINPSVQGVAPQATPLNFTVTNSRGGLTLNWSPVTSGDGYEILKSPNGSFTDDLQVIPVKNTNQSSFFDSMGGNAQTASYRIRTTSGTAANPQSQRGPESGVISHTSIDASDTLSVPTTLFDNYTTDKTRAGARLGNYGGIKPSTLGKAGGAGVGSGTKSGAGTSAGTPAKGATSFASLKTSTNNQATLIVGSGAQVIPDPTNPGIIDATQLQGENITLTPPTDQQVLQYSAAQQSLVYTNIIAVGTQVGLPSVLPLGLGEIYVAYDTGNLFIGTPNYGAGYLQVGDMSQLLEAVQEMIQELKSVKLAILSLDNTLLPQDFEPFGRQISNGDSVGDVQ